MPESGVFFGTLQQVLRGLPYTLLLTFVPLAFAFLPGLWFGWLRAKKSVVGSRLVGAYVTLFRSLPLVLQMLFAYSWLPSLLASFVRARAWDIDVFSISPIYYALIVLFLNTVAALSEVFRAAFSAVSRHEVEAALAVGYKKRQAFFRVWLPQAVTYALPNLASATVNLVRQSSLAYLMTVPEMTARARMAAGLTFDTITAYAALLLSYVVLCFVIDTIYDVVYARVIRKMTGTLRYRGT
ncbi:MAG TPA: ABC transporter permease subunit [Fastidiosipila sp.]|jgi:L-cystine transport system permease protein|nr:ABC transporter permease subunit [Fastidiosipila sp.]